MPAPQMKLDILVCFFAYGGNGGVAMQLPSIGKWWAGALHDLKNDPRIGRVAEMTLSDTPITMTRNRAVKLAREGGFHLLMMVDSDNEIDLYVGKEPSAKPFLQSSLDFVYDRCRRGVPTVIAAPYCGPPPHPVKGGEENVYVFRWANMESDIEEGGIRLTAYERHDAAIMVGIQPAAALPTGCCLFTTDAFDLTQTTEHGFFYYEWKDDEQTEKASTEDVTATRDIGVAGRLQFGEDVVFCNWDAWAGHHKPKCVGKPRVLGCDQVGKALQSAVLRNRKSDQRIAYVDFTRDRLPEGLEPVMQVGADLPSTNGYGGPATTCKPLWQGLRLHGVHDPDVLTDLADVVREVAARRPLNALRCIEVGSKASEYAVAMTAGFSSLGGKVWSISPRDARESSENIADIDQVCVVDIPPKAFASDIDEAEADVVFLDSDDPQLIASYMRHVAPWGVFCGTNRSAALDAEIASDDDLGQMGSLWTTPGWSM